jgi:Peptidase family M48
LILAVFVSACGDTRDQRAGSGAAIGAGAGAVVGAVAGPAAIGGAMVGALAGGVTGVAVHEIKTNADEPKAMVQRLLLEQQARLWNVSYPILTENAGVCREKTVTHFGFVAWTRWDVDRHYGVASMGLDDRLRVVHILPGSPAATAGLMAGDEIESVGGHDMPAGKTASTALELVLQRKAVVGVAQTFRIRRGEAHYSLSIVPDLRCDIDLIVTESDHINEFNYGQTIYLTDGLMRYFSDDQQLAAVVAHLVAHVLLEHETISGEAPAKTDTLQRVSLSDMDRNDMKDLGTLPGVHPYSEQEEIQADRAALELLVRADYRMDALIEVWQRLAKADDSEVQLKEFHPPSPERQAAIKNILDQVRGQSDVTKLDPAL